MLAGDAVQVGGAGTALEIHGARLLALEETATAIPDAAVGEITDTVRTLRYRGAWRAVGCRVG